MMMEQRYDNPFFAAGAAIGGEVGQISKGVRVWNTQ